MAKGTLGRDARWVRSLVACASAVSITLMAGMPASAVPCQCRLNADCPQQNQHCDLAAPCTVSSTTGNVGICMGTGSGGGSVQQLDAPLTIEPGRGAAGQDSTLVAPPDSTQQGTGQRSRR